MLAAAPVKRIISLSNSRKIRASVIRWFGSEMTIGNGIKKCFICELRSYQSLCGIFAMFPGWNVIFNEYWRNSGMRRMPKLKVFVVNFVKYSKSWIKIHPFFHKTNYTSLNMGVVYLLLFLTLSGSICLAIMYSQKLGNTITNLLHTSCKRFVDLGITLSEVRNKC